jgi:hypothetical protein
VCKKISLPDGGIHATAAQICVCARTSICTDTGFAANRATLRQKLTSSAVEKVKKKKPDLREPEATLSNFAERSAVCAPAAAGARVFCAPRLAVGVGIFAPSKQRKILVHSVASWRVDDESMSVNASHTQNGNEHGEHNLLSHDFCRYKPSVGGFGFLLKIRRFF